jgi:hypothetical protein
MFLFLPLATQTQASATQNSHSARKKQENWIKV